MMKSKSPSDRIFVFSELLQQSVLPCGVNYARWRVSGLALAGRYEHLPSFDLRLAVISNPWIVQDPLFEDDSTTICGSSCSHPRVRLVDLFKPLTYCRCELTEGITNFRLWDPYPRGPLFR